ncbi:hypothetical protein AVEN_199480-1 [Araneus ventricosus]|uniref:Uncharacterized protein n=1 Tax=Araneus ventricosus TaxID=182803 RepID=A0A4Y2NQU5_ARAVE|nr:hypothetical protein AVEN_38517-1 [Araneus ventricosus]GBN40474.1 hypothetical protein AVEN_199480-1 [Araneus ventricosus]
MTTPELTPPSLNFRIIPGGGCLAFTYDLACYRYTYTADLQWNGVSSLKPSSPEAENLPLGHRGPYKVLEVEEMKGETPQNGHCLRALQGLMLPCLRKRNLYSI